MNFLINISLKEKAVLILLGLFITKKTKKIIKKIKILYILLSIKKRL